MAAMLPPWAGQAGQQHSAVGLRWRAGKSLDGLFHMVAREEKNIRSNPAARTTDLLKTVFGR